MVTLRSTGLRAVHIPRIARRNFSKSRPVSNQIAPTPPSQPVSPNLKTEFSREVEQIANTAGRIAKYIAFAIVTTTGIILVSYEGLHQYIERVPMAVPSRGDDEYGWEDEVQGWTGGPKGGTDSRLGWKGRHAIRAAWMYQNWGAGEDFSVVRGQGIFESDYDALRGMIGFDPTKVKPDRGFEMANTYLDVALDAARSKGMVFPPTLSVLRPPGPPRSTAGTIQADPAVLDLLLLKAGALERAGTSDSVTQAKELYEQVISATHSSSTSDARIMRLANKVGTMCARLGDNDEALAWWGWALDRVGLHLPTTTTELKTEARSWFGKAPVPEQPTLPASLPPPTLRATISLLIQASTHFVSQQHIAGASTLQTTALSLLPAPRPIPKPTASTAGMNLHHTWLEQRSSLLALHLASTTYALGRPAQNLANIAVTRADTVLEALSPVPGAYTRALFTPAQHLHRDALLTAAEASYTKGLLLERQAEAPLQAVAECFERAMTLHAEESGRTEAGAMGDEWQKYWKSFARVKQKLGQPVVDENPPASAP